MKALEALTVKLSERAFKPLFLRFVEWARAAPPVGNLRLASCLLEPHFGSALQHLCTPCADIKHCIVSAASPHCCAATTSHRMNL